MILATNAPCSLLVSSVHSTPICFRFIIDAADARLELRVHRLDRRMELDRIVLASNKILMKHYGALVRNRHPGLAQPYSLFVS